MVVELRLSEQLTGHNRRRNDKPVVISVRTGSRIGNETDAHCYLVIVRNHEKSFDLNLTNSLKSEV